MPNEPQPGTLYTYTALEAVLQLHLYRQSQMNNVCCQGQDNNSGHSAGLALMVLHYALLMMAGWGWPQLHQDAQYTHGKQQA